MDGGYLLDVNVLLALTDELHVHHEQVTSWFEEEGVRAWSTCALTQAGFIRLKTNPKVGGNSVIEAAETLRRLIDYRGHRFWTVPAGWVVMTKPFAKQIFGHQQVTDAYLLGAAVHEAGVVVTLDKAMRYLAGLEYSSNLLILD